MNKQPDYKMVTLFWVGEGDAPATVRGAGFSLKSYEFNEKEGTVSVDERDVYTILNRRLGDWAETRAPKEDSNVSSKGVTTKNEPPKTGDQ